MSYTPVVSKSLFIQDLSIQGTNLGSSVKTEGSSNLAQCRILTWGRKERTVLVTVLETLFLLFQNGMYVLSLILSD